ncbi:MAG: signal peptidase I [Rhodothermales bacterium]|nr:signal peptidase I [Rhodothermales bacterium]MBO6781567.1 signal peptidase I [Rhodothermales bacterium]
MAKTESSRAERKKRRADRKNARGQAPQKSKLREWLDAVVFAVVVMTIVRTLFFDLFRIPTPSMEKSLLVGDYLMVSKLHYGTRTPMTLGIPFTGIYLPGVNLPNTRFPGFSEVKRGDAIVFNWPADEGPIDRREHYIKRVIGLPGESVQIDDKAVLVDGERVPLQEGMQQTWDIVKTEARMQLSGAALTDLGVSQLIQTPDPAIVRVAATEAAAQEIGQWPWVEAVRPAIAAPNPGLSALMYPSSKGFTPDNYGPLPIPSEGQTVTLTAENWEFYAPAITRYEGHDFEARPDGSFAIDGVPAETFTFSQDYFFVMGDNRDNSEDSRFWGYVPMSHVVGKAVLVYFSWDASKRLPRFGRIFSLIR